MSTIRIYEWNGHTWAGWWQGDEERPTVYEADVRQRDRSGLYLGMVMSFDVPNGDDWSDAERGLDRHTMEATQVDFYSGDYTLEGFVSVEKFGRGVDDDAPTFRKQRWVITRAQD